MTGRRIGSGRIDCGGGWVIRLGGPLVSAHLLVDDDGLTLIDTGLVSSDDLLASYAWSVHRPPRFLTRNVAQAEQSLRALAAARPAAVLRVIMTGWSRRCMRGG